MTNIQAINLLKGLEQSLDDYCELNDEGKTAFRMAITALELFGTSEQLPSAQPEKRTEKRAETHACDLIDRQAAIDALGKEGLITAMVIIDRVPSAQPEQRWIPVDLQNNSPEENKVVLLGVRFRDDFKYFITSRQDYNYWTGLGREIKGELRWQALPEPYREEGEK